MADSDLMLPLPGFPGYFATTDGVIWSTWRRGPGGYAAQAPRPLKDAPDGRGYRKVTLVSGKRRCTRTVHRLILETFVGFSCRGEEARHLNGNRTDNRLDNLAWGTSRQNQADRASHGTVPNGESHPASKISTRDVQILRSMHQRGTSAAAAARQLGVNYQTAYDAIARKTWRHVR